MIHVPGKLVYISLPRTYGDVIEAFLIRRFPDAVKLSLHPETDDPTFTSIRNPFALVLEWFDVNPEHRNFLQFINHYEHSHFVREGTLFWTYKDGVDVIRDERVHDQLASILDEDIELVVPPLENYRDHYNPDEVSAIQARFANDLELFEYSF